MSTPRVVMPAIASGLICALPAGIFVVSSAFLSWGEYRASTYLAVSAVFWALSFLLGSRIPARIQGDRTRKQRQWLVFRSCVLAWLTSLLFLAALNVTPLCVGQDNGDGTNTIGLCCLYTVVESATYSVIVVGLVGITAVTATPILARLTEPEKIGPPAIESADGDAGPRDSAS